MIQEERGSARAKRDVAREAARAEREAAAAEERRLMEEVFEWRLPLALVEIKQSESAVQGSLLGW